VLGTFGKGAFCNTWEAPYFTSVKVAWFQAVLFISCKLAFGKGFDP
jgi:hypothetical protein